MLTLGDIERAGRVLADAAGPAAKVILFGSHARGDAQAQSDLDFLVIEPDVPSRVREMARLRRALPPLGVPIDVIVVSELHAEEWGEVEGTLLHAALTEGRLLGET